MLGRMGLGRIASGGRVGVGSNWVPSVWVGWGEGLSVWVGWVALAILFFSKRLHKDDSNT